MNAPLRVGLVGCGVITQRTAAGIHAILAERNAAITALCDPLDANIEAVSALLENAGAITRCLSLEALIAARSCDAVILATPIGLHFAQVEQALQSGLHVYTHKTLANTRAECERLEDLARTANRRLAASPGQILLPAYARAARLVGDGELGTIASVDATAEAAPHRYEPERAEEAPADGQRYSWEWYHRKELGGGPLDDMFVYPLAFLTAVFGEVEDARVFSQLLTPVIEWRGRRVEATAPDCYAGVIRFAGATATIRCSFSSNTQYIPWGTVVIRGTEAALEIIKHDDLEYSLFLTPNSGAPAEEKLPVFSPEEQQRFGTRECHVLTDIREFVDSILEQRPVRGATAGNAARVAAALRFIEEAS